MGFKSKNINYFPRYQITLTFVTIVLELDISFDISGIEAIDKVVNLGVTDKTL